MRLRLGYKPTMRTVVVGRISRLVTEKNPQTFILVAARCRAPFYAAFEAKKAENITDGRTGEGGRR